MTVYYVSKAEGNDGNDGEAPTDEGGGVGPKLTIGGAEALEPSGDDIIYIGPGTYYENITLTDSGTEDHPIKWKADPECEHLTGDTPGIVRWSACDSDDTQGTTPAVNFGSTTYVELYGFILDGCQSTTTGSAYRSAYSATCKLYDCLLMGNYYAAQKVWAARSIAIGRDAWTNCYTENCLGFGFNAFLGWLDGTKNCQAVGAQYGFGQGDVAATCYNCVAVGCSVGFYASGTENAPGCTNCHTCYASMGFQNMAKTACTYAGCLLGSSGGSGDAPTEGEVVLFPNLDLLRRAWEPLALDCLLGAGHDDYVPTTTDILNRTRQQGTIDVGAYELADQELDYSVYQTAAPSIKITDEGEVIVQISAEASTEITVTVQVKDDTAGTKAQIVLRGQSIADQTDTLVTDADWEELSVTATPTINEVLELVLRGRTAGKVAYFSDITVT